MGIWSRAPLLLLAALAALAQAAARPQPHEIPGAFAEEEDQAHFGKQRGGLAAFYRSHKGTATDSLQNRVRGQHWHTFSHSGPA
ncbi:UNVERIFIED_CONTAM: hypothetical protein K2H54_054116 [Gekko kuhli]